MQTNQEIVKQQIKSFTKITLRGKQVSIIQNIVIFNETQFTVTEDNTLLSSKNIINKKIEPADNIEIINVDFEDELINHLEKMIERNNEKKMKNSKELFIEFLRS